MTKKLGFIVNPVAGIGGRVGLKGSDGPDILRRALSLGAVPEAPRRARQALIKLKTIENDLEVLTWSGAMGEEEALKAGFRPNVAGSALQTVSTPKDTENAARRLAALGADLLIFAGGDGTARNIYQAVGNSLPVVGIPAGVKIHSAVYATCPASAGLLALTFLTGKGKPRLRDAEVMDIDEDAFRKNRLSAKLYGYMKVPYDRVLIQGAKAGSRLNDDAAMDEIASDIIFNMTDEHLYIVGSGTTTQAVMNKLALPNTLLGIDAVYRKTLAGNDLSENSLLELLKTRKGKILVTVIGGQGHVFGRGNPQISPRVIRRVGKENIIIAATEAKILGLQGRPLLVDTGDPEMDDTLCGYTQVVVGLRKRLAYRIAI